MVAGLLVLVFAQLAAPAPELTAGLLGPEPLALAAASPRPRECRRLGEAGLWATLRHPELDRYCRTLGRGQSQLRNAPELALEAAKAAEAQFPERVAPGVLQARALVELGKYSEAWELFARALKREPRAVEDPEGLHDLGLAARLSHHPEEGLRAYRALAVRARLVSSPLRRTQIYVEAAFAAQSRGPDGLPEALGYLREAQRTGAVPGTSALVLGTLALALDRAGRHREALDLAEESDGGGLALDKLLGGVRLCRSEITALQAQISEPESRNLALQHWQEFLAPEAGTGSNSESPGPWTAHARAAEKRLQEELGKGVAGRRAPATERALR